MRKHCHLQSGLTEVAVKAQVAEFQVRVAVLIGFTALGTPITEVAG